MPLKSSDKFKKRHSLPVKMHFRYFYKHEYFNTACYLVACLAWSSRGEAWLFPGRSKKATRCLTFYHAHV